MEGSIIGSTVVTDFFLHSTSIDVRNNGKTALNKNSPLFLRDPLEGSNMDYLDEP